MESSVLWTVAAHPATLDEGGGHVNGEHRLADLEYHPVLADAAEIVAAWEPDQFLLIGDVLPSGAEAVATARQITDPGVELPTGTYCFDLEEKGAVMVVDVGGLPGAPMTGSWADPDDSPLVSAYAWFVSWLDGAAEINRPVFAPNQPVVTVPSGQFGQVVTRSFVNGQWSYKVLLDGGLRTVLETGLAPLPEIDGPEAWVQQPPSPAERFTATLTRQKLSERLTDTVYSFRASRTIFRPYQFRPVVRLLEAEHGRLLIADEVGLGKTIEAGLIWTELDAREQAGRVLVVCPSMLVAKWQREMEERFGFDLPVLDKPALADFLDRVETDRLPSSFHAVVSIERLRGWDGLEEVARFAPHFDLIIVDEAHAFRNVGTKNHALGVVLSEWADALVFLSATPLNLANRDLYNLLELLAPGEFDDPGTLELRLEPNAVLNRITASLVRPEVTSGDRLAWLAQLGVLTFGRPMTRRPEFRRLQALLRTDTLSPADVVEVRRLVRELHALSAVVTRTRKLEIQEEKAMRSAKRVTVDWTAEESELYAAIEQWQLARAAAKGMPVGFVGQMPLRLAGSCLPAARDRILAGERRAWDDSELANEDELEGMEPEDIPPADVVERARALGDVDTKFDAFLPELRTAIHDDRQVLIFTFSRHTLAYLERRLGEEFRVAALHGGVKPHDRARIMAEFRAGDYDLVVASRVASEGLDFEFCSAVVNYDLPWNPMEVEQRIGRIDRFGQQAEMVVIINFHTPGTIESDIVERVHQRINVFNDSIGELEPILQSKQKDLRDAMFDFSLSPEQRQEKVDQQLAAIEAAARELESMEETTQFLAAADNAEIEGFEQELLSEGRYVGQPELVRLIDDWFRHDANARMSVSNDGHWLRLRGTPALERQLREVTAKGERSALDISEWSAAFRDERERQICLDQEVARRQSAELLAANHPLVRAALRVPGHEQARFASLRVVSDEVPQGSYLVLVALARWNGIRPTSALWTAERGIDSAEATDGVGNLLLARLAEAGVVEGPPINADDLGALVSRLDRDLIVRQQAEMNSRQAENEALLETRRTSLEESHASKSRQIQTRIETIRQKRGAPTVIRLHEAQLAKQDQRLADALSRLEATRAGEMTVEPKAVCVVEVTSGNRT